MCQNEWPVTEQISVQHNNYIIIIMVATIALLEMPEQQQVENRLNGYKNLK